MSNCKKKSIHLDSRVVVIAVVSLNDVGALKAKTMDQLWFL